MNYEDTGYLESVYAALLELLKTAQFAAGITIKNFVRASAAPEDFSVADQPALYLVNGPMLPSQENVHGVTKWSLGALIVVVARGGKSNNESVTTLTNHLVWGIVRAMEATKPPYQKQTLEGLVYHCWLDGEIRPEMQDQQIVIGFPVHILLGPVG